MGYELWVMGYEFGAGCKVRVAGCEVQGAGAGSSVPVTGLVSSNPKSKIN